MDSWATVIAKAESWAKICEERLKSSFLKFGTNRRDDPINILKRLQREAFYEIMKLRERQEKLERASAFYKTGKGSPFQDSGSMTRVRGIVSVNGEFPILNISEIKMGIESKFIFETLTRGRDTLVAELVAGQTACSGHDSKVAGSPLSLSKVTYLANINDSLSLLTIPCGAKCQDFDLAYQQSLGPMVPSSFDPPLLHWSLGCAAGIGLKCSSKVVATAALSASNKFSSFGQVNVQLLDRAKVTIIGLRQAPRSSTRVLQMSQLEQASSTLIKAEKCSIRSGAVSESPSGSAALVLESELDESSKIRGWVEIRKPDLGSSAKKLQWGISLSDAPEDEMGWGLSIGGSTGDNQERYVQVEGSLNFCIGKRLNVRPGLVCSARSSGLIVSSQWTF